MADPEKTTYHFEQATTSAELRKQCEIRYREGWKKAGDARQVEVRLPNDRFVLSHSQALSRTEPGEQRVMRCMGAHDGRPTKVFWGEISPCEHWLQVYADEQVFYDSLERFVTAGLAASESVVVIVVPEHREGLERRLVERGTDIAAARAENRYIALDAEETLGRFMVNGWPDENLFRKTILGVLEGARAGNRRVRAFGEMVALLWARRECGATVRLEHLWHVLCQLEELALFCAYPRSGFTKELAPSLHDICAAHSRIID